MEYVDGKDVRTLLERHRAQQTPIPPEHVAWIAMEVAHALQRGAHAARRRRARRCTSCTATCRRRTCCCSYHGEVKLCDFGIAKATSTRVQTKTGVIKGKVKYMSPEQAMGRKLDHRSDLFSLGTVMYEMLTLEAPFLAADRGRAHLRGARRAQAGRARDRAAAPRGAQRDLEQADVALALAALSEGAGAGAGAARVPRSLQARLSAQPLRALHAQRRSPRTSSASCGSSRSTSSRAPIRPRSART